MTEEKFNPNSMKYFDADRGMTYNHECPSCQCATFAPERIDTCYEGKRYSMNKPEKDGTYKIVGVLHYSPNLEKSNGVWCETCYVRDVEKKA